MRLDTQYAAWHMTSYGELWWYTSDIERTMGVLIVVAAEPGVRIKRISGRRSAP